MLPIPILVPIPIPKFFKFNKHLLIFIWKTLIWQQVIGQHGASTNLTFFKKKFKFPHNKDAYYIRHNEIWNRPVSVDLSPVESSFGATYSELLQWQYDPGPSPPSVNRK